ncbi:4'-phosphopantetheinyl transferase family protein [Coxiella burnetii]|uniref:4'-phosphopantetheinyl transferase family protein n=1 Tax=Coxiella burnetii TaxID=777 RepID=UPI0000ED01DB|nr:4'-phosphopantetheinyl transferase superfamily protein [Coxiella burnetii]ACJ19698.1 4'-phosphopantetheinyl transferase [Coxiella burnetii CbuK_Q154]ATN85513.1 phosphopantetheine-protein transferase [Coxiella burnetii str. Schperling]EAX32779.1 phosphopantetheine-protein transferase [Coxiella burnetii 'MSU Goat Q177']EDR36277.1 phosphopantetheinyl transferase [Coxiella burnetii Q321]PHH56504.1 phosphopantetheine-protein transferase [Coxiella burnetii]
MDNTWKIIDEKPSLLEGDVHVWRVFLDRPTQGIEKKWEILSPEEQARADRFVQSEHRRRFVTSHAALHAILTSYLPELKGRVRFRYNDHGKPYLKDSPSLQFNLSDSRAFALCAVTRDREVGIDIEFMKPGIHAEQIAERFFSPEESQTLKALPAEGRLEGFYRIWTLKEAYIKAIGQGLSFPLQKFTTDAKAEKDALLWVQGEPEAPTQWSLSPIPSAKDYMAALAVQVPIKTIHYFDWAPG